MDQRAWGYVRERLCPYQRKGIAVFPEHGKDIDLQLKKADAAMYAAKQSGRGFVVYGS